MLHQTLPTFLSIQSFCSSSAIPSSLSSNHQVKMEGATVTKALKTSCWPETNMKASNEMVSDDVWMENVIPGVGGDDFFVDDLLDFSKDEVFDEEQGDEERDFLSVSSHEEENLNDNDNHSNGVSFKDDFSELSVPADDLEQLEWLSHFVEDSFSVPYPKEGNNNPLGTATATTTTKPKPVKPEPTSLSEISEIEPAEKKKPEMVPVTPFPARARSKRSRTGVRVWSLGSSSSLGETSGSSESSISSGSSASVSASTSCLIFSNPTPNVEFFYHYDEDYKPPSKKPKKKRALTERSFNHHNGGGHGGMTSHHHFMQQQQRRCSHCGVQKTPQWRTGPEGAKTLCNACGVRYKSGRLLPEYRPACSPTFSSEVHSNSHRKVLEMRRKKEVVPPQQTGFAPRVQSF